MCLRLLENEQKLVPVPVVATPVPVADSRMSGKRAKVIYARGRFNTDDGAKLTPAAIAFGRALEQWKRVHHCPFPTFSDVLNVLLGMGYRLPAAGR